MTISTTELRGLVQQNRVHRRVYTDPAIFELELDRIFGRAWLYVAHESEIGESGDFVRASLGRYDVVVVRGRDRRINVLHNRCAHRGARFCSAQRGNARSFICPYHGWSFAHDGRLEAVPHRQSYPADFALEDPRHRLFAAPRVESYRGFVFASFAVDGPSLVDHLGVMREALDNLVDRAPDGAVEIGEAGFRLEYRGNWKLHHENAADIFHPGFVHESSVAAARRVATPPRSMDEALTREQLRSNDRVPHDWEDAVLVSTPEGHSYRSGFYRGPMLASQAEDPVRRRYRELLAQRHGDERTAAILGLDRFNTVIFPNLIVNAQYQQLRVVEPIAVDRSRVRARCFRLKGAPDELYHRATRFLSNIGSPASMIFTDDAEIFARCQKGLAEGGADWVDFSRGWGTDQAGTGGSLTAHASELPMRALHAAWVSHMAGASAP